MGKKATSESGLYPALKLRLNADGYLAFSQFGVHSPLADTQRLVDVIGFRWGSDGTLDCVAVEAKEGYDFGAVLRAVPQACEYQVVVPKVYVATEAAPSSLGFVSGVLKALGLGYITAQNKASVEWEPRIAPWPDEAATRSLGHAGALCLLARDLEPDADHWPHTNVVPMPGAGKHDPLRPVHWSFWVHAKCDVQLGFRLIGQAARPQAVVWVQAKATLKRIIARLDASRLHDLFQASGGTGQFVRRRVSEVGRLEEAKARVMLGSGLAETTAAVAQAQRWVSRNDRCVPVLDIALDLWPTASPANKTVVAEHAALIREKLRPLHSYLRQLAGTGAS